MSVHMCKETLMGSFTFKRVVPLCCVLRMYVFFNMDAIFQTKSLKRRLFNPSHEAWREKL